ncbi:MAG: trypsin-like peptidase domain-containing protein [Candidatus Promineifilaceae bacterium]|nr:trypsin-like peptidase domain-containing protein [Candidatus Promineifilaceae bacterium]
MQSQKGVITILAAVLLFGMLALVAGAAATVVALRADVQAVTQGQVEAPTVQTAQIEPATEWAEDVVQPGEAPAPAAPEANTPRELEITDAVGAVAALEGTLEQIYEEVNPSVVHIQVLVDGAGAMPQIGSQPQTGQGTGFVWDEAGHIVTNNHVIEGAQQILVTFADGQMATAEIVGTDPGSDLAVVRVDLPAEQLHPVSIAKSTTVKVGELVIAIGNPFGQKGTMTMGIVSALGRLLPLEANSAMGRFSIPDIIQTDAAINPGNSGGVLLNDQGAVIGVTTAIVSPARVSAGIGYAVPSIIVQKVVPSLIERGLYAHPCLGISGAALTPPLKEALGLVEEEQGVLVMRVVEDGPSTEAGLRGSERQVEVDGIVYPVGGDVITAIDGEPVHSMDDVITYLARYKQAEETTTLTVLRDGQTVDVTVTLGARPTG